MFLHLSFRTCAAAFGLLAAGVLCPAAEPTMAEMQDTIADLRAQNSTLERSLVQANKAEKEATEQLAQIRLRLEALGKNLLDGGNDRVVQAVADLEIARERNAKLEQSAGKLISAVSEYLRQAVVSDPDARQRLETALRELDTILGFRDKPRADVRTGLLQKGQIVSVDSASGMVVLNIGENQGVRIGMSYDLSRGGQHYAKAVIVDVRKAIAGAFIETNIDPTVRAPKPGDLAVLRTE